MLSSRFPTTTLFPGFETATALFHSCSIGNALSLGQSRENIKLEKQVCLLLAEGQEARLALPPLHLELPSLPPSLQLPGLEDPRGGLQQLHSPYFPGSRDLKALPET